MTLKSQIIQQIESNRFKSIRHLLEGVVSAMDTTSFRFAYLSQVPRRGKRNGLYRHEKITYQRTVFLGYRFCKGEKPKCWYLFYNPSVDSAQKMDSLSRASRLKFRKVLNEIS